MYPWDGIEKVDINNIQEEFNQVATYVKEFELPENMKENEIFISFKGVESALSLWINGNFIGYSEDSFTPCEF